MKHLLIAIDGPAGSGKSTISRILARRLNLLYIDTGAMYRAFTLKVLRQGLDVRDHKGLVRLAKKTRIELKNSPSCRLKVYLDGRDVSRAIRRPQITKVVSDIAKVKGVREVITNLQRRLGERTAAVLEGRDIATVVFPHAPFKFFLDADFSERTERRFKELSQKGEKLRQQEVAEDLANRDRIDSTRKVAPLKKAKDAVYIDSTNLSIQEVARLMLKEIRRKWRAGIP